MPEIIEYPDGSVCAVYPAVEGAPAVPARWVVNADYGWNSSAKSAAREYGNCYVEFDMPDVIGTVVGLAPEREGSDPITVPHGIFFEQSNGRHYYSIVEFGEQKTTPAQHNADAVFRIERSYGLVAYKVDDVIVYRSELLLTGSLVVVACMYAASDGVGRA